MLRYTYSNPNDNIVFLQKLMSKINNLVIECEIWAVGSLMLVPKYNGDYPPSGESNCNEIAFNFMKRVERERIAYVSFDDIQRIFQDTQCIREGVFFCFPKLTHYNYDFFPVADVENVEELQHPFALVEVRVIDGDIFEILSKEQSTIEQIREMLDILNDQ
ncbi:hypothetical protein ABH14_20940 [Brevibacillus brevis]|uniref:hypothetical protein n=1 Tax=Brevibacillus brevis TaxID=1393 RepID=UPI0018FF3177|nr:hypothetical protein [Brevibacillus brevis]MBH0332193.1 hypothetical protein [Brevibacillus brevis]